jgi:hypothetical protein
MNFLETITALGNDVLVPINRIKYVYTGHDGENYCIKIASDDGDWVENFGEDEAKMNARYNFIKHYLKER